MPWVTKLAQMNLAFENLIKERDRETADKTHIAVKTARAAIDEAYRYIVKSINAMLHLEQLTGCEEFVDTMNAIVHRYKTMIHQQHGHHHGTGTTPSTPANPPDVISPINEEFCMTIFTKLGRALLLAAAVAVGALWIAGCGGDSGTNNGNGDGGGSNNGVVDPSEVVRGTFTDSRDGQTYKTVKIGRQRWTAENLNIETADSRCYNDSPDSCAKYGRMYTWAAAKTACPTGWHLPSRDEWNNLETAAGGSLSAGKKLKSTNGWYNNGNGTDDYGFSALPGGGFGNAGSYGSWWTASENGGDYAYYRYMGNYDDLRERNDYKSSVFSVRCVED